MNTQNNGNNGKKDDGNKGRGVVTRILLTLILFFIVMISYMFISAEIDKIPGRGSRRKKGAFPPRRRCCGAYPRACRP